MTKTIVLHKDHGPVRRPGSEGPAMSAAPQAPFGDRVREALADDTLQGALAKLKTGFRAKRGEAVAALPDFDGLRAAGKAIKSHTLANLDTYLEAFEAKVIDQGGEVHWCRDAEEARRTIVALCRDAGAGTVAKGKSMIAEEIALNEALEDAGLTPVETDLGEYIIQLRHEMPSHIVAPAIHLKKEQIADSFRAAHADRPADRPLDEPNALLTEARAELRKTFLSADVGITGANMLIAETGATVIVTNEGNGDLTQTLPGTHIVLASIEKVVPTMADAAVILRLLARSATGQEMSSYTTFSAGPKRAGDRDGPAAFHVVLLDNGRSAMLGGPFAEMLRCIRCGSCLNHCPVYGAIGGHAYGWVYPGPMGSVLTPALHGLEGNVDLPHASTLCGRCQAACPMDIPLPKMLRQWREEAHEAKLDAARPRWAVAAWAFVARRPRLYRLGTRLASLALRLGAGRKGRLRSLPGAGGWTAVRDLPAPSGKPFFSRFEG